MFTGLIEDVGKLLARKERGAGARLTIATHIAPLVLGESISVMGVCLTVDSLSPGGFEADASAETLSRTTLQTLSVGSPLHLERALALGSRLGGHIVSGHVDCKAKLLERKTQGEASSLSYSLEPSVAPYVAVKGSVALDGVSLTVNAVQTDRFSVMIIPHTQQATVLGTQPLGTFSNLEVDLLARYVVRWLQVSEGQGSSSSASDEAWLKRLSSAGYL